MAGFSMAWRKIPLLWFLVVFMLFSLVQAQTQPRWVGQFEEAYSQLRDRNLAGATRHFEALWKSNPGEYALANAIGTALDSTDHHVEATEWYQKALRLNPGFVAAYNNLALNYAARGEFRKAVAPLQKATRIDPRHEPAFYNLGLIHLQLGNFAEAAQALERAHELKPRERDPLVRLAYARFRLGQRTDGLQAITELTRLSDEQDSVLMAARVLNSAGQYRDALRQAREARSRGPNSPALAFEEATALFHLGQYQQAVKTLQEPGAQSSSDLNYYLLFGSAQALSGNLPAAVSSLQTAVQVAPKRPEPYYRLALVFIQGFRDQDAVEVLSAGLQEIPNSPLLLFGLGVVNEVSGRYQEAIGNLRKSLQAKHEQPAAWSILGELYAKVSQYDEAEQAFRAAVAQGAAAETSVKYADLLIRLERFAEAEKLLRQVLGYNPRETTALVTLGKLYNAQRKYALAEKPLRSAIELDTDDGDAHLFLAAALRHLGRVDEAQREGNLAAERKSRAREPANLLREVLTPVTGGSGPVGRN